MTQPHGSAIHTTLESARKLQVQTCMPHHAMTMGMRSTYRAACYCVWLTTLRATGPAGLGGDGTGLTRVVDLPQRPPGLGL